MKIVANEIFGAFERFNRGECTRDKALEDASRIIEKYADEKPIVGYFNSKTISNVLNSVIENKEEHPEKKHTFLCEIHVNEIETIERILKTHQQCQQ